MKVLQINIVVNYGSTGYLVEEIGQKAKSENWDSYIAYARKKRKSESKLVKIGNIFDIYWHGLQTLLFDRHGLASKKATKNFIDKICKIKPDIIHLHNIHGYYINYEILFSYLSKVNIPVVWTLHDCWPITGHCSHFTFAKCNKWKSLCYNCAQKKTYPKSIFKDRSRLNYLEKKNIFNSVNDMTIVVVSDWLKKIVKQSFLSKYPIKRIYNGIDTSMFAPRETANVKSKYNINNKFIILGIANIWNSKKGFEDFIKLSSLLDEDEIIMLVGISKAQSYKLPKNIIGIRRTEDKNELIDLYSAADVVTNLSYEESFGLTTIEGMSCGIPCIVYDNTASPELITPETGLIVKNGNIKDLYKAVKEIKQKGKLFYSDACRERAINNFSNKNVFDDYLELYNRLLSKKNKNEPS